MPGVGGSAANGTSLEILPVSAPHGGLLAALHAASFPPADQWDEDAMQSLLSSPGVAAAVGVKDGTPAGFIMIRSVAGEAEILTLCVVPFFRRQGVAQALLAWALLTAQADQVEQMFLEVSVLNAGAKTLYENAGFAKAGLRRSYYPDGSDALVLSKRLDD
ncbi:GNAT family N-acetyltransferase [Acetobacter senegalensis]|uniref:GNAT family N-acetyltransferase n=1 Tax=Acetobacter senegalensis TaxID=446692 RepID=UPI001EDAC0B7|nr:GNAT family N-acetyltransferase [Acetobacter senegalensis]